MPKYSYFIVCALLLSASGVFSQNAKKTLVTQSTKEKITIDGKFDEEVWKTANIATDFFMINPDNGKQAIKERQTEVKVVYDNTAIYIAATMYDEDPSKQRKELALRDNSFRCLLGSATMYDEEIGRAHV